MGSLAVVRQWQNQIPLQPQCVTLKTAQRAEPSAERSITSNANTMDLELYSTVVLIALCLCDSEVHLILKYALCVGQLVLGHSTVTPLECQNMTQSWCLSTTGSLSVLRHREHRSID